MKNNRLIFEKIELINQKGDAEVNNDMELETRERPAPSIYRRLFKEKSASGDNRRKSKNESEMTSAPITLKVPQTKSNQFLNAPGEVRKSRSKEFGDRYMFRTNHSVIIPGGGPAPNTNMNREPAKKETKKAKKSEQGMFLFKLTHFVKKLKESSESYRYRNISSRGLRIINDLGSGVRKITDEPDVDSDVIVKKGSDFSFKIMCRSITLFLKKVYKLVILLFPKCRVLKPNDWFKLMWDVISLIILSAFYIYLPLQISFKPLTSKRVYVDCAMFIFLLIDVGLTLNTGIFMSGMIIEKKIRIRKHYVQNFMIADFLAVLPFVISFLSPQDDLIYQLLVFFKFTQYLNNLNLIKDQIENLFQGDEAIEGIFSLIKLILTILFIAHFLCCIFHYIAISEGGSGTWLSIKSLETSPWEERYLYSIYWSIVTMITVGYGDITPQTSKEVLFTCCAMLIGCGMFAYSINIIGVYTEKIGRRNNEFKKKLKNLNRYMKLKNIENDLQIKVRKYMEFVWSEEANLEEEAEFVKKLSSSLRKEFYLNSTGKILNGINLFNKNFSRAFISAISEKMKLVKFSPEDIIYKDGDSEDNDLYILLSGCVNISFSMLKRGETTHNSIKTIKLLDPFGEESFITGMSRRGTARSEGFSSAYVLRREEFMECLKKFPGDYESFCFIRDNIKVNGCVSQLHIECSACSQLDHTLVDCRYIQHKPMKMQILAKYAYSSNQKRGSKVRREQRNQSPLLLLKDMEPVNQRFQWKYAGRIRALIKQANPDSYGDEEEDDEDDDSTEEQDNEEQEKELKRRERALSKLNATIIEEKEVDPMELEQTTGKDSYESKSQEVRKKSIGSKESSNRSKEKIAHVGPFRRQKVVSVYTSRAALENLQQTKTPLSPEEALSKFVGGRENRRHSSRKLNISLNQQDFERMNGLVYDALRSFRRYFPYNNVERVIEKMRRQKRRRREVESRFQKTKCF